MPLLTSLQALQTLPSSLCSLSPSLPLPLLAAAVSSPTSSPSSPPPPISSGRPPWSPRQVITGGRRLALSNMSGRWISLFLLVPSFTMLGFKAEINSAIPYIIQDQNGDTFYCFEIKRQPGAEGLQVQEEYDTHDPNGHHLFATAIPEKKVKNH